MMLIYLIHSTGSSGTDLCDSHSRVTSSAFENTSVSHHKDVPILCCLSFLPDRTEGGNKESGPTATVVVHWVDDDHSFGASCEDPRVSFRRLARPLVVKSENRTHSACSYFPAWLLICAHASSVQATLNLSCRRRSLSSRSRWSTQ